MAKPYLNIKSLAGATRVMSTGVNIGLDPFDLIIYEQKNVKMQT